MTITHNNKTYTDNSNDATINSIFIVSNQNKQFKENAQDNGCTNIIDSKDIKNEFDFSSIKIVGITGTNGKTTTAAAIYSILLDLGYKVALQGTRGFFINDEKIEDYTLTTPVQLSNFNNINQAINQNCNFFIMEVSSHAISQNRIEGIDFELKVITNITQDHLDYHKDLEEYIAVKNSFFQDDTMKLINKDDKNIKFKMKNAYAYGAENPATYKVSAYSLKNGLHVAVQHFSNIVHYSSPMIGFFNVYNLTAAIASVNLLTKKPLQDICNEVENFAGVTGRMEVVNTDPMIVVDFAHTPDGMKEVFISFATYDIITVFGAGGDRDRVKRPMMGKTATFYSKEVIITSDNPRFEDPDKICDDIIKGCKDANNYEVELNRKLAISKAIEKSKKYNNPIILILGKGDEETQIVYNKAFPLNDKKIVDELLNK